MSGDWPEQFSLAVFVAESARPNFDCKRLFSHFSVVLIIEQRQKIGSSTARGRNNHFGNIFAPMTEL